MNMKENKANNAKYVVNFIGAYQGICINIRWTISMNVSLKIVLTNVKRKYVLIIIKSYMKKEVIAFISVYCVPKIYNKYSKNHIINSNTTIIQNVYIAINSLKM